jgi:hypothetical protein
MPTRAPIDERPSGVPGLIILGTTRYGFRLAYRNPQYRDNKPLDLWSHVAPNSPNRFVRVRDAKAAAERIRHLLPWHSPVAGEVYRRTGAERRAILEQLYDGLSGTTAAERQALPQ